MAAIATYVIMLPATNFSVKIKTIFTPNIIQYLSIYFLHIF